MIRKCFGCKPLPELHHGEPVPACLEPIVPVRQRADDSSSCQAAYECVCCGRQWLETDAKPGMTPRFVPAHRSRATGSLVPVPQEERAQAVMASANHDNRGDVSPSLRH